MEDLRGICADLGWSDVRTYIASGNVVFSANGSEADLAAVCEAALPFETSVFVRSGAEFQQALAACPFPVTAGKLVHGYFCDVRPTPDQGFIKKFQSTEQLAQRGSMIWLYAPDGFARSKLAENMHRVLPNCKHTARNLNTIQKLSEMLDNAQ